MEHPVVFWAESETMQFQNGLSNGATNWYPAGCTVSRKKRGITFAITHEWKTAIHRGCGTNKHVRMENLNLSHLENASHVHRSGFWYTPNLLGEPTIEMFKRAKQLGVQTSLDVGWAVDNFSDNSIAILRDTLQHTDIFFANEREVCAITRIENVDDAIAELLKWVSNPDFLLVLHRGESGSAIINSQCRKAFRQFC